jgi:hypothetical protein
LGRARGETGVFDISGQRAGGVFARIDVARQSIACGRVEAELRYSHDDMKITV